MLRPFVTPQAVLQLEAWLKRHPWPFVPEPERRSFSSQVPVDLGHEAPVQPLSFVVGHDVMGVPHGRA